LKKPWVSDQEREAPALRELARFARLDGVPLDLRPKDFQLLSQKFASLISLCSSAEYIQAPLLSKHPYHIPYLHFPESASSLNQTSSMRQLVLSGVEVLDAFVKDVLVEGGGSKSFPHLESLALFEFNANSPHLKSMLLGLLKRAHSEIPEDGHPTALLPNLRFFHLQDGVLTTTFLPQFLQVTGARLERLTLLNLYGAYSFSNAPNADSAQYTSQTSAITLETIRQIKSLTVDVHGLLCLNVSQGLAGDSEIDLTGFKALTELEIRLTEVGERVTPKEWRPEMLSETGFPEEWVLLDSLPDSLKEIKLIAYSVEGRTNHVCVLPSAGKGKHLTIESRSPSSTTLV